MIESIFLSQTGPYDAVGTDCNDLKPVNFIFGPNGSGKTTISRVITHSADYTNCQVSWRGQTSLETRVYNRDYVRSHFEQPANLRGIYTLGEDNADAIAEVDRLQREADRAREKLISLNIKLNGPDDHGGKRKERADRIEKFKDILWNSKLTLPALKDGFEGFNGNKSKFFDEYQRQTDSNTANILTLDTLTAESQRVFSRDLQHVLPLTIPSISGLETAAQNQILSKVIVGKKDVSIAALIERLQNSDWVQQGRKFLDDNTFCPFCQQATPASLAMELEEYFDEVFETDLADLKRCAEDYKTATDALVARLTSDTFLECLFIESGVFSKDVDLLKAKLTKNLQVIASKQQQPSQAICLEIIDTLWATVKDHIDVANTKINENNSTLQDQENLKKALRNKIWRYFLERTKTECAHYEKDMKSLNGAVSGLETNVLTWTAKLEDIELQSATAQSQITSIQPSIDGINRLLSSFGFNRFQLVASEEVGLYDVRRLDGTPAINTLSEGEKSFITFLYFFFHLDGSHTSEHTNTNRIVVFDDPVSSLDSEILFIVCNLVKEIIRRTGDEGSPIKQIFILTHNIYFHKEVTFDTKRSGGHARQHESFWTIRKLSDKSLLSRSDENPIKSSYELLWAEVRQENCSPATIQNVLRRIIEHYFKFFGGITPEKIIEEFEAQERIICASLFSWVNDGSHFAIDDLYLTIDEGQVTKFLEVFRSVFEKTGHLAHYEMMIGETSTPTSADTTPDITPSGSLTD